MSDMEDAIKVSHVSKAFKVYLDKGRNLKDVVLFSKRRKYELRQVLDDISFTIKKGETVALIGHNGCGKSTTLKLLTRIMYPDSGTIKLSGRVSALIELGAGFHPDMSGRENIYINASIFGLTKSEIDKKIDDMINFSELKDYIDNPVRTYSSGMYMRLAFSVAINVSADILLIDEILAVGDINFQEKCYEKMQELKKKGVTIVLVTHDMNTVKTFCDKAIWINDGHIAGLGNSEDIVNLYMKYMTEQRSINEPILISDNEKNKLNENHHGNQKVVITDIELLNEERNVTQILHTEKKWAFRIHYINKASLNEFTLNFKILSADGYQIFGTTFNFSKQDAIMQNDKSGTVIIECSPLLLHNGRCELQLAVQEADGTECDFYKNNLNLVALSNWDNESGLFHYDVRRLSD